MVRTRFAPSPTGYLHIGGVRTALYNWLFSRQHGGRFVLRIDDTDADRNVEAALEPILHGFRWLGLDWDEGPEMGGDYGPYFQSQRHDLYRTAVEGLLSRGAAYRDFATTEELQKERETARDAGVQFVYSRRWAAASPADEKRFAGEGRRGVVRLKMPRQGFCRFTDRVRGPLEFEWAREQDHVIQRPDGSCLYHLASAVDDHAMGITHVIRAEEHLSNTPRHIFIAQSLGYPLPEYAHLPYVAEPGSKTKLSKRKLKKYLKNPDFAERHSHGREIAEALGLETAAETFNPVIIDFYEQVGYLPEALLNYLLLLGWALDDRTEFFSRDEMVASFSLERVQKSPASFDPKKLWAFQDHYMQELSADQRTAAVLPYLEAAGAIASPPSDVQRALTAEIAAAAGDRIKTAGDVLDYTDFFCADERLVFDETALQKLLVKKPEAVALLAEVRALLYASGDFSSGGLESLIRGYLKDKGMKLGQVVHALRVALTGKTVGFGLFETMAILGRRTCLARIDRALDRAQDREPEHSIEVDGPGSRAMSDERPASAPASGPSHFIKAIIEEDLTSGKHGRIRTRFPPEPNGYLHIGHAKAICVDFGLAGDFGGTCNLRFDDTNPLKEDPEYVESIKEDIRWLGFDWEDREYYASDYFERLYEFAVQLVEKGKAYVDDLTAEEIRQYRGTLTEPGRESPYRDRPVEENFDLLERMRHGEFADGSRVLRAKIDMAAGNLNMRDPVMYRILHAHHYRRADDWCIYPTYDFTHGQSDSIEEITHSLCTLEFEDHRPLYDWFIRELEIYPSRQIEFARLNISYTLMSKRKLRRLVEEGCVAGWDDPRMPTLSGLRRRGYTPEAIRDFCDRIGVAKAASVVELAHLEHCLRQDLNRRAPRVMGVLKPLKVVLTNYPQGEEESLEAVNNPEDDSAGKRQVPFSRELWIERTDFMEDPPKKFYRLAPGREVRLRWGFFIRCEEVIKDLAGEIVELRCTYDPETRGGYAPDGRKVRGTIHWVSARHALAAEVRLYDHLFTSENPDDVAAGEDFTANLNPDSLEVLTDCRVEPSLAQASAGSSYQFERTGYFCVDPDSTGERLVFNRTVSLRDSWARMQKAHASA